MYVQVGFDLNERSLTELFLRFPRRDKVVVQVVKWLLHQPGIFEVHDFRVEIAEQTGGVRRVGED